MPQSFSRTPQFLGLLCLLATLVQLVQLRNSSLQDAQVQLEEESSFYPENASKIGSRRVLQQETVPPLLQRAAASTADDQPKVKQSFETEVKQAKERTKAPFPSHETVQTTKPAEAGEQGEQETSSEEERLNVVILYGDDWTLKTLGSLNPHVKTPNLDAMADRGMLFTHNCVTTSICMISRATMYTGQYASTHKTYLPRDSAMFREGVWNQTLFSLLKQNGYHTGMVGKWHHPDPPKGTFDFYRSYQHSHFKTRNGITKHITQWNEEDALEFLKGRPQSKNFALLVSFFAIHAEDGNKERYRPQNKSKVLYVNDTIPTPKTATEKHFQDLPYFFQNGKNYGRGRWKGRYSTPELYQKMMKNMYRMTTEVDEACGRILEELKRQNVLDKTLVIFTTDNGNMHGEHGLAEKWFPYEESIRVPLIIQDPRMPQAAKGKRNSDFTLNIDLAPTILGAANIPVPSVMQGRDMSELYNVPPPIRRGSNQHKPWRKDFYYEWFTGSKDAIPASLALVARDSKYILWPEYEYEQLFRLDNDPFEEKDLFQSNLTTDEGLLKEIKARFSDLKGLAESGVPM